MILNFLLEFFLTMINSAIVIVPKVTLPVAISSNLTLAMGYWNTFEGIFPFAEYLMFLMLTVILPFELGLLLLKFFLGSRAPHKA